MWIVKVGVNWKSRTQGNSRIGLKIKKYREEQEQEKKKLGSALRALKIVLSTQHFWMGAWWICYVIEEAQILYN